MSKKIKVGDLVTYVKSINRHYPQPNGVVVELTYDPRTLRQAQPVLCAKVRWNHNTEQPVYLEYINELEVLSESR